MPSNLNSTPRSSANCCMSRSSCTFTVTATDFSASGSPRSSSRSMPRQALLVRAGHAGQPLVGVLRPSVQGDLDRERTPLGEVVGNPGRDERTVGEEGNQKPLPLRVGIDVEEIAPREDLPAREQQPQAPGVGHLVENPAELLVAELGARRLVIRHRQVVVAVDARQRAPPRHLDGAVQRQMLTHRPLVKGLAEFAVADGFHVVGLILLESAVAARFGDRRDQTCRFEGVEKRDDVVCRLIGRHVELPANLLDDAIDAGWRGRRSSRYGPRPRSTCRWRRGHRRRRRPERRAFPPRSVASRTHAIVSGSPSDRRRLDS